MQNRTENDDNSKKNQEGASPRSGPAPCPERTWCVMTDPHEHASYHAGTVVDLDGVRTGADGEFLAGWWCSPSEERGRAPKVGFERADGSWWDIPGEYVAVVLRATRDAESRRRLQALIDEMTASEPAVQA